ncbi:MAG: PIN domain-containing protein [Methylococcaceae bacterium]
MKVVLDTNMLLVSIAKKSPYRIIFDSLLNNKFDLIISNDILSEYTEIIALKTNKDDNKFVDCAIASNADYLVSNDKHFNCLKTIEFPKLSLLGIDEFMDLLLT